MACDFLPIRCIVSIIVAAFGDLFPNYSQIAKSQALVIKFTRLCEFNHHDLNQIESVRQTFKQNLQKHHLNSS